MKHLADVERRGLLQAAATSMGDLEEQFNKYKRAMADLNDGSDDDEDDEENIKTQVQATLKQHKKTTKLLKVSKDTQPTDIGGGADASGLLGGISKRKSAICECCGV